MSLPVLVAGGGIGGLATALALSRAGLPVTVLEQAAAFSDVGAGIQLGPNAGRLLDGWGLGPALRAVAAMPQQLLVRDAHDGCALGTLRLGAAMRQRYGHDYLSAHRADLHGLLLAAARQAGASIVPGFTIKKVAEEQGNALAGGINHSKNTENIEGQALIGCDGLWSVVRAQLLHDGPPHATGHLAYRALLPSNAAPKGAARQDVTVWLGPLMHVVCYPVRGGDWLNLVAVVHGEMSGADQRQGWVQSADVLTLLAALPGAHSSLRDLVQAAPGWTRWVLHDRPPLRSATPYAQGRIALLGDAAHPMRPYLAQGAAMALEDAAALAQALQATPRDVPLALQQYAAARWRRNARVQQKSLRNGRIFHAQGPLRLARNLAMRLGGERLLDTPWLYGGGPTAVSAASGR